MVAIYYFSMTGSISITNRADLTEIDIEGIIGIPEWMQFDNEDSRIATYDKFRDSVNQIRGIGSGRVVVNIRSMGGSMNDAFLIHDTLRELDAEVTTKCFGYVASAATIIAQAASQGKRQVSDNSLYLIHRSSTVGEGNRNDIQETIMLLDKTDERIASLYAGRSGRPAEGFAELMDENGGNGRWLSPQETVDMGLADTIVKGDYISNVSLDAVKSLGLPSIPEDKVISTTKTRNMKVKKTWKTILDFFGFDGDKENELTESQVEKLNDALEARMAEVSNLSASLKEKEADISEKESALKTKEEELGLRNETIKTLENRVSELEAENALLKTKKTEVPPTEDPVEGHAAGNKMAYEKDVLNFK